MGQFNEVFIQYGLIPLLSAVVAGIVWIGKKLASKWDAEAEVHKLSAVGARLAKFAAIVVQDLENTVRPEMAKSAADGKLTADEMQKLRELALQRLKELMTREGLEEVRDVFGIMVPSVDSFLRKYIDLEVAKLPATTSPQ